MKISMTWMQLERDGGMDPETLAQMADDAVAAMVYEVHERERAAQAAADLRDPEEEEAGAHPGGDAADGVLLCGS